MKKSTILLAMVTLSVIILSCNKDKQYSRNLSGEEWEVKELVIDGVAQTDELPVLEFEDCDIYNETCNGIWEGGGHSHGSGSADEEVKFAWQVRDKGKVIEISNQSSGKDAVQCWQLSGVYDLVRENKEKFELQSSNTQGYPGKMVKIVLEHGHDH